MYRISSPNESVFIPLVYLDQKANVVQMKKPLIGKSYNQLWSVVVFTIVLYLILLSFDYSGSIGGRNGGTFTVNNFESDHAVSNVSTDLDSCFGRYIYVHDLPGRFNDDVLKNCKLLNKWLDMCPFMGNSGLGPQIKKNYSRGVLSDEDNSWFSTNQFMLEVIFRERMKQYKCLTNDSSMASAIYVPFYAGLDIGRYLWGYNTSVRDSSAIDIVTWLANKPEWKQMWGRDHFFVAGRIAWDFRRQTENDYDWGSKLMLLPEFMNITMLSIESSTWSNEFAIPYPTYFHPSSESEVVEWQNKMRNQTRQYLFSFAGAPRPSIKDSIRDEIIRQCLASKTICKLIDCQGSKCDNPFEVIKVFQDSVFCLQPPGDSYTRRSTFDSILAGCIPVFFHPASAYAQYQWHLPKNPSKYSVFIPTNDVRDGKVLINKTLLQFSNSRGMSMREEVIQLIPKIIYADPRSRLESLELEDAFSIAVKGVLERVENVRKIIREGKDPSIGFAQENTWKFNLSATGTCSLGDFH